MLECRNLRKSYQGRCVVNNLSFQVNKGEVFAFLGSNGAGKTTTIKMILGLVKMDSGEVKCIENIKIGYSPETPYFPPFLTGYEVLEYYAGLQKIAKADRREEIEKLLETVGLENNKTKVKNYSKGMLQRLALAQALLGNPDLLILDEPTAGLDPKGRDDILAQIQKLQKEQGIAVILVSHSMEDVAKYVDRIIAMGKGRVQFDGTPEDVFAHAEELKQIGLGVPQVTELGMQLAEKGFDVPHAMLNLDDMEAYLVKKYKR